MEQMRVARRELWPVKYIVWIVLILAVSLVVFFVLMQPPVNDIMLMAVFLSVTAAVSALAGYGAYRLGWVDRSPTIRWSLLAGYALASVLTFLNVWILANLMFTSEHDLLLATVLLLFAGGMAMALGYILSTALASRIQLLDSAARRIAKGDLEVRIPAKGQDEIAELALSFNQMAAQLQDGAEKQQEVEGLRRDLIAWVGHDLQTPLASIRAIVEALADGVVDDPETEHRYLITAQKEIRSLSNLIDDLFQMAQLDAGGVPLSCEYNSISDLVSDTLESFSELASRGGIHMEGSVADGIDPVYMDAPLIGRALNNLLSNALRYTPEGGTIQVSVSKSEEAVLTEICNTGEGIRDEDLPHIFERFYRGEKSRSRTTGGSGLGLAITKGIVEAHGGEIEVKSVEGQTCFSFTLPLKGFRQ
jgi:signal transduction histidine kinase